MSIDGQGHFFTIYYQVLYVLCFIRPRYQVSVYRTIGPPFFFFTGKTPVTPGRRPYGDPTAESRGARSTNAYSTAATQWHRHWTRWDRIERQAMARTLSILKTNTVTRRSLGVLIERRGDTVRSP